MGMTEQDRKLLIFALKSLDSAKKIIHVLLEKYEVKEDLSKVIPIERAMSGRMLD